MAEKWTPEPWRAVRSDPAEGADVWWICAGDGNQETELGSMAGGWPQERRAANAHLVAAAPDLAEALSAFREAFRNRGETTSLHEWNEGLKAADKAAAAALAKARGE